jgi:energy-coupling factor transporter ATP-binding protein EcfA2
MLMTKCIVLICGPPACLKSTLVQILRLIFNDQQILNLAFFCVKKLDEILFKKNDIKIQYNFLSFDDLFYGYENEIIQNELNWKFYRLLIADEIEKIILSKIQNNLQSNLKYSSQILDRLYQSLKNLNNENIIFIEDNFYYSSMRHRYRQIAQRAQIGFVSIHLYSNLSIALQRNQKREISKRVSNISIENIYSKYELSNDDLVINTTDRGLTSEHLNKILQRIEQACNEPEQQINIIDDEQRRRETEINQQNFIYQIDQRLRKFISKYLKEEFSNNEKFKIVNEKKIYAEMINDKRQKFLDLIRHKFILLNNNEDIEQIFQRFLQENN